MIEKIDGRFILHTAGTTYCFRVLPTGHLEHLYYGRRLTLPSGEGMEPLFEKHAFAPGNTNLYDKESTQFSLEDVRLEMSSYGKGDIREPFVEIVHADGSSTSDFLFESAEIKKGKDSFAALPGSYGGEDEVEQLCVTLRDSGYGLLLELYYYVYEDCDVICRSARLINNSKENIRLLRLLSAQLDFDEAGYVFTSFNGGWAREMRRNDVKVCAGRHVNASYTGTSSSRANPFVMLSRETATEDFGECYGVNLIYSGNHYECCEVSSFGKTRLSAGINPQSFCFVLEPGECFEAPEAVMTYSANGYNGMSAHMHKFVREHIVRGEWRDKERPVLLNSWEAAYFDIDEHKLLKLAKAGKEAGVELFVMDDGWFGERNDDTSSLGDWEVNKKKLPSGISGLSGKIRDMGLLFGIWVEPEMVSVNSRLYEEHSDWALQIPDKPHSEGRNQRILDLTRKEVQDYVIEAMSGVFASGDISYVKWDMNRTFTDCFSAALPAKRQGETAHRYVLGLYRCMRELTERFPHILFEGCAAGGNRFDLGILCYFPQIWASDDTDALCRAEIQNGYSYGYPLSAVSAHVSACPNHQTLRITPLETRFNVACFGSFGYECNFCDMKKEDLAAVKEQIALYKKWRGVLQRGDFYRGRSFTSAENGGSVLSGDEGNYMEWTCVAPDKKSAVGLLLQKLVRPNTQFHYYMPKGLMPDARYHFFNRKLKYNVKEFGDLVNTVAPIHIKQDSLAHNLIAKFVKMEGEQEDFYACGDTLMYGGVRLKQSFGGTGYSEQVRFFQDFGSRIYFMEAAREE
ncbi:MAG: alpha-galactosidase [Butyrivibrio sp.]|nr:alpha-galactosidase [Butyrivibrio sp.]